MDQINLIEKFYTAFQQKDWKTMQQCYHPEVEFSDPVFQKLKGREALAMWHMLVSSSSDLQITYTDVEAKNDQGSCRWEAKYSFSKTNRKVYNQIHARFLFKDGLIIQHNDTFDLWKWSRMALGLPGLMLGWTPWMKGKIRKMAVGSLQSFISKNPSYR